MARRRNNQISWAPKLNDDDQAADYHKILDELLDSARPSNSYDVEKVIVIASRQSNTRKLISPSCPWETIELTELIAQRRASSSKAKRKSLSL